MKYKYHRWPEKRWEQKIARHLLEYIESKGEKFPSGKVIQALIPKNRLSPEVGKEGQNLEALAKVAGAISGVIPLTSVQEFYRVQRANDDNSGVGLSSFEGNSEEYFNYQCLAALTAKYAFDSKINYEATRFLRRKLAWYLIHTHPMTKQVISSSGRNYDADPSEHLEEISRVFFGLKPVHKSDEKWWEWAGTYSAQPFLIEDNLFGSIFTVMEEESIGNFIHDRIVEPPLQSLLSELYAPANVEWKTLFYTDGRFLSYVNGLRSYIAGNNGVTVATVVDSNKSKHFKTYWFDNHTDVEIKDNRLIFDSPGHGIESHIEPLLSETPLVVLSITDKGFHMDSIFVDPSYVYPKDKLIHWGKNSPGSKDDSEDNPTDDSSNEVPNIREEIRNELLQLESGINRIRKLL